mmetsp:Transcript_10578/g.15589  ORF Transcript_10578/g.15589 Transcript_10578/m.15589 type:complete len:263 (+) Transcript_10578:146-934(+)
MTTNSYPKNSTSRTRGRGTGGSRIRTNAKALFSSFSSSSETPSTLLTADPTIMNSTPASRKSQGSNKKPDIVNLYGCVLVGTAEKSIERRELDGLPGDGTISSPVLVGFPRSDAERRSVVAGSSFIGEGKGTPHSPVKLDDSDDENEQESIHSGAKRRQLQGQISRERNAAFPLSQEQKRRKLFTDRGSDESTSIPKLTQQSHIKSFFHTIPRQNHHRFFPNDEKTINSCHETICGQKRKDETDNTSISTNIFLCTDTWYVR